MRFINRKSDGTTYWSGVDGWMAAPTQIDNTPDLNNVSYVVDCEEHISPEDYATLTAWLRTREADPIKRVLEQCRAKEAIFQEEHDGMSSAEYYGESGWSDAQDEAMREREEEE